MSQAEKLLEAASDVLHLEVLPEHRVGVLANIEVAIRMAALIEAYDLDDESEPAPVYRP